VRDDSGVQIEFRTADPAQPPASDLLAAMVAEMNDLYGDIEFPGMPSATPADFAPPAGAFLVGYHDGEAVCAGGIKPIAPDAAEIKRMYVAPAARRRGVARRLLAALEDAARERGYAFVRLDTGPEQRGAMALYASEGYTEIGNFNANPIAAYWGEKRL
jgi:GNAT superfamily N-acetyltransferase